MPALRERQAASRPSLALRAGQSPFRSSTNNPQSKIANSMHAYLLSMLMIPQTAPATQPIDRDLLTVAEASEYTATASHAQVLELIERIRQRSKVMRVVEMGKTSEGKS